MLIRFKYEVMQTHTRVHVYCGASEHWLNLSGLLILTNAEWTVFRHELEVLILREPVAGEKHRNAIEFMPHNPI